MIGKKVLTKIVLLLIVLFGVTILTFVYTNLSPVDAAEALAVRRYSRPTAEQIELVREELGLDKPILQQYGSWLWNALHGDFGNSIQHRTFHCGGTDGIHTANFDYGCVSTFV